MTLRSRRFSPPFDHLRVSSRPAPIGGYATGGACAATAAHFNPSFGVGVAEDGDLTARHGTAACLRELPCPKGGGCHRGLGARALHRGQSARARSTTPRYLPPPCPAISLLSRYRPLHRHEGARLLRGCAHHAPRRPGRRGTLHRHPQAERCAQCPAIYITPCYPSPHAIYHPAIYHTMPRYLSPHAPLHRHPQAARRAQCAAIYPKPRYLPAHAPLSITPGERWGCANIGPAGYGYTANFPSRGDGSDYPEGTVQFFQAPTTKPVTSPF